MSLLNMLQRLHLDYPELNCKAVDLYVGDVLFREGEPLTNIYAILEGKVRLYKKSLHQFEDSLVVDTLNEGKVVGIMAFATRHPSLTTAVVLEEGAAIRIPTQGFYQAIEQHPKLYHTIMGLLTHNLGERYRHALFSQLDFDAMNHQLDQEKARLKEALEELERTQTQLVQKEKMATLGQLTAGFAHEVNNPAAALIRGTEVLIEKLPKLIDNPSAIDFFLAGREIEAMDTETIRTRSKDITSKFPQSSRAEVRLLAQIPDELLEKLKKASKADAQKYVECFESGKYLRNIDISGRRIAGLVQSMKNYARQDRQEIEPIDIRQGIKDTLLVLSNRTKFYHLQTDLGEVPKVLAKAGSLNQVWTNLIVNACDAMGKEGRLSIKTSADTDKKTAVVRIEDSGGGIPEAIKEKVFEANFSTKDQDTKFGLGLGLHLSKGIVEKLDGQIWFEATESGTIFYVSLPAHKA